MKPNLILIAGTRPELIKIYPVLHALEKLGIDYTFIWSGQHKDFEMSTLFFKELDIPEPDIVLNIPKNADLLERMTQIGIGIKRNVRSPHNCIIYSLGDTSTTAASALVAHILGCIFVHDEAGTRSYDPFMIEEGNRKIADALALYHLSPTILTTLNLLKEGVYQAGIFLTGSTAVDTFNMFLNKISPSRIKNIHSMLDIDNNKFILVTLHRRENLEEHRLNNFILLLKAIAEKYDYDIVLPLHPHTRIRLKTLGLLKKLKINNKVKVINPLGYLDFISLIISSFIVMTDSGGVQQEAFLANKYTLTLRPTTEWIETVIWGLNFIVDMDIVFTVKIIDKIINADVERFEVDPHNNPMGDGTSGKRIAYLLKIFIDNLPDIRKEIQERFRLKYFPYGMIQVLRLKRNVITTPTICFDKQGDFIVSFNKVIPPNAKKHLCIHIGKVPLDSKYRRKIGKMISIDWKYLDKIIGLK